MSPDLAMDEMSRIFRDSLKRQLTTWEIPLSISDNVLSYLSNLWQSWKTSVVPKVVDECERIPGSYYLVRFFYFFYGSYGFLVL